MDMHRVARSQLRSHKATLFLLFQISYCKQYPFIFYLTPIFFAVLCFLLAISLFQLAPKHSAEVLGIPKYKKAVMSYRENTRVNLHLDMNT